MVYWDPEERTVQRAPRASQDPAENLAPWDQLERRYIINSCKDWAIKLCIFLISLIDDHIIDLLKFKLNGKVWFLTHVSTHMNRRSCMSTFRISRPVSVWWDLKNNRPEWRLFFSYSHRDLIADVVNELNRKDAGLWSAAHYRCVAVLIIWSLDILQLPFSPTVGPVLIGSCWQHFSSELLAVWCRRSVYTIENMILKATTRSLLGT